MPFALTDEQRRQIDAESRQPAEAMDPLTDRRCVLLPIEDNQE